jgi:RNA recognition motif-containing protein
MNNKIYVGNLSFRASSEDLHNLFAEAGTVESARVIEDRDTGRSRGFGFVEMGSADEASAAIEKFNGMDYDGRSLAVKEALPREDRGGGGGGGRRNYNGGGGGGSDRGERW